MNNYRQNSLSDLLKDEDDMDCFVREDQTFATRDSLLGHRGNVPKRTSTRRPSKREGGRKKSTRKVGESAVVESIFASSQLAPKKATSSRSKKSRDNGITIRAEKDTSRRKSRRRGKKKESSAAVTTRENGLSDRVSGLFLDHEEDDDTHTSHSNTSLSLSSSSSRSSKNSSERASKGGSLSASLEKLGGPPKDYGRQADDNDTFCGLGTVGENEMKKTALSSAAGRSHPASRVPTTNFSSMFSSHDSEDSDEDDIFEGFGINPFRK